MFHMKHKVNRGTSLPMKAAFAVTPLFLFFLAVAANGDEPAIEPVASKPRHADSNRTQGQKATEATEIADELKAVLESVSEGAPPGMPQAQGKPGSNRTRGHKSTEIQRAIETIVEGLAREVADEHKAVLQSVSEGAPGTPQAQGKSGSNRARGRKATETREIADELKAVLESVSEGAPGSLQSRGKPDSNREGPPGSVQSQGKRE